MDNRSNRWQVMLRASGFTLIELIIALAIFSIISVPMFAFAINTASVTATMSTSSNSYEQARIALEFIVSEIRMADDLAIKCDTFVYSYKPGEPYTGRLYMLRVRDAKTMEARSLRFMVKSGGIAYNRLDYGGKGGGSFYYQELASNIDDIFISIHQTTRIMTITVRMLTDNDKKHPITLKRKISLKHKNIVDIEGI